MIDASLALAGVALLFGVLLLTHVCAGDVGDLATRNTVRLSLAWYFAALCQMLRLDPDDSPRGRLARWCWTWALVCFYVHLGMAFHYFHQWSHAHALEHTRQVSGVGEGIFVSYLFALLWGADAAIWWADPAGHQARSPWIGRCLHGFMLFIVFNGTIVYESGLIRWAGVLMFLALAAVFIAGSQRLTGRETRQTRDCWESRTGDPQNGAKCSET
jgi:hypothetical protein